MKKTVMLVAGAVLLAAAMAALLWWSSPRRGAVALRPDDREVVARGAAVYRAQCAACHGERLQGQPNWRERSPAGLLPAPPHDASGHTWHHPDEVLFRITKYGVGREAGLRDYRTAMPVYEGVLSDADIVAVLSWIKAQWPADIRGRQERIDAQYRDTRRSSP